MTFEIYIECEVAVGEVACLERGRLSSVVETACLEPVETACLEPVETACLEPVEVAVSHAAQLTLQHQAMSPPAELTILLTDDARLKALNRDFRQQDKVTDVLSFPAGDEMPDLTSVTPYLGDIAISVPVAERQAQASGHATLAELQLLTIHGVLHLLGHDHANPEQKQAMWDVQTAVLTQLGLQNITPTET